MCVTLLVINKNSETLSLIIFFISLPEIHLITTESPTKYFCRYFSGESTDGIFPSVIQSVITDEIKPSVITNRITDEKFRINEKRAGS